MHKQQQKGIIIQKNSNRLCSSSAGARGTQTKSGQMFTCILDQRMVNQRMVKVKASVLLTLPGLESLGHTLFDGKTLRQLGRGQEDDEGNDVSGYFVLADGGAAVIFKSAKDARQWANNKNQVNIEIAPSLTYIDSDNVSLHKLTNIS